MQVYKIRELWLYLMIGLDYETRKSISNDFDILKDETYDWWFVFAAFTHYKFSKSTIRRWLLPLLSGTCRSISKKQFVSVLHHNCTAEQLVWVIVVTQLTSDPITHYAYNKLQSVVADYGGIVPVKLLASNYEQPKAGVYALLKDLIEQGFKPDTLREAIIMIKCAIYCLGYIEQKERMINEEGNC